MAKTAMIRARTEPQLKDEVEKILHVLGLSFTEAINIFFRQIKLGKGIPFDVRIPNKATLEAMRDVNRHHGLVECKDALDLFKKLGL